MAFLYNPIHQRADITSNPYPHIIPMLQVKWGFPHESDTFGSPRQNNRTRLERGAL